MVNKKDKGQRYCTHCHADNHVVEKCFRLPGFPDWHPKAKVKKETKPDPVKKDDSSIGEKIATGFAACSGISKSELSSAALSNVDWIVDSGASDHVSCDRDKFVNFSTSFFKTVLLTADGETSKVVGIGSIPISSTVILENVLYVLTLSCNLLSVSKITRALNCTASFSSYMCLFQDNISLATIGSGR